MIRRFEMCYTVPAAAAIVTTFMWMRTKSIGLWHLLLLFLGASVFGIIDHLWRGEFFLISKEWAKDLALGLVITLGVTLVWGLLLPRAAARHR